MSDRSANSDLPAVAGGSPVRAAMLPYGRQSVDDADIAAVVEVLRSDWLTTGPVVKAFEDAFAQAVGAKHAVAVNSGTAALHTAMFALGIGPGDEVIVPTMTFAASASAVVMQGAKPVFADVDPATLLIDPVSVRARITSRTRAIVSVDFAGQPCDYGALSDIASEHDLSVVSDACHSLGAQYREKPVGCLTPLTAFSFHPVKVMTTAEGGMVTTSDAEMADRMRSFRNHCLTVDHHARAERGSWGYAIHDLGWNYRLNDMQCALGLSQLGKLGGFVARRQGIARRYEELLADIPGIAPLRTLPSRSSAYHLFVVQLAIETLGCDRAEIFAALRAEGIGVNVHYQPVHLQPFYQERFGSARGDCPVAEAAYERIISLPIFPAMTDEDVDDVVRAIVKVLAWLSRKPSLQSASCVNH